MRPFNAFTLVELLVVVAIISLLIAILLPSLDKARQAAMSVVCLTHLRQIHFGSNQYLEDNSGWAPYPAWTWHPRVGAYLNTKVIGGPKSVFWCQAAGDIPLSSYSSWNCAYTATYGSSEKLCVYRLATNLTERKWVQDANAGPPSYRAGDWNVSAAYRHLGRYNYVTWAGNAQSSQ